MSYKKNKKMKKSLTKKNKKFKSKKLNKCSPSSKSNNNLTCFDRKSLIRIAKHWNKTNKDKIKISGNNNTLWKQINNKLDKFCDEELCWLDQNFIDKKLKKDLNKNFKPKMPENWKKNPKTWLTTVDIRNVMKQYDDNYNDFIFIGPVPIDFDYKYDNFGSCIVNELCNINVEKLLKKNISKIGIIFNTDPHYKSGEHWIALYADFNKGIYYFDSYGIKPPSEVNKLMNRLKEQSNKLNKNIKTDYNKIQHQFKNSECGVYSMHFIIKLLEGGDFENITKNIIYDDTMHKNRYIFYRH